MANYKRKGHRGRHKRNVMDNQSCRKCGNSQSKQAYWGNYKHAHVSKSQRNVSDEC
jgi:hypothetical protein